MDSRRAESFSDGVFAVAITVLVFNLLPIADATARSLTAASLGRQWPAYLAYVVSFLTIGIMWINHHQLFAQITRVDRPVLVLNLILLMGIVAIPFPTALVADHLKDPSGSGAQVASVTYGLVMIAISCGYAAVWLYLTGHPDAVGARRREKPPLWSTIRFTGGSAGYVAGTLIAAFAWPLAAVTIYGLLAVYYMFEHLPDPASDSADQGSEPGD
jgi:TMEM175 potassium channel family protein